MTLQELSDNFHVLLKVQSKLRKVEYVNIEEGIIAQWISEAQNQLAALIGMLEAETTLTLVDGQMVYALPADFKRVKLVYIPMTAIPQNVSANQNVLMPPNYSPSDVVHVKGQRALGVDDFTYAVEWDETNKNWQIEFVMTPVGAPNIIYSLLPGVYSPSGGGSQEWGSFNGTTYSGSSIVGDEYAPALKYYMLGEVFPDLRNRFREEVQVLQKNKINVPVKPFDYDFAGSRR